MNSGFSTVRPIGNLVAIFGPGGFCPANYTSDGILCKAKPPPPPASSPKSPAFSPVVPVPALTPLVKDCAREDEDGLEVLTLSQLLSSPPAPLDPIILDCFEAGDKVELVGPSKCRKSFFAIDLAIHMAAGIDFLEMGIRKPRRVLLVNLEIKEDWMKRRINARLRGYGIDVSEVGDRLNFINARSKGEKVRELAVKKAREVRAEVVIIDPRYKLMRPDENENAGEGIAGVLNMMDDIAESGPACFMVSHDAKGTAGDRDDRDRGAGSGWAGRDVDCRFILTPHAADPNNMAVLSIMRRNYPPAEDATIRFESDRITLDKDTEARKQTSRSRVERSRKESQHTDLRPFVKDILLKEGKPITVTAMVSKIQRTASVGEKKAAALLAECENDGLIFRSQRQPERGGSKLVGLPEQMEEYRNPKLPIG